MLSESSERVQPDPPKLSDKLQFGAAPVHFDKLKFVGHPNRFRDRIAVLQFVGGVRWTIERNS